MTPAPTEIHADPDAAASRRFAWRFRLIAWSLALSAVAFIQAPGRTATDTKLDLTADPWGFLGRSLDLWDPLGAFGQVQNQAYGYLFPMGPFFGVLLGLDVPPWVAQRLWWALVLVVAFLGVVKLCGVMRIGAPWTRILAGLAFALSPRFLSVLGASSVEVWPSALAPWVLVPLVVAVRRGDPRRAAALSALAVAVVGGVNAAATFAVMPLAACWLLLAAPGPRRRMLLRWCPLLVALGTAWWLVPLFLLGRYSPPFLDHIESADNTTFAATLLDALRGTTNWVPYVDPNSVAGHDLLSEPLLVANGVALLALGVFGLARRDLPARRFWVTGLVVGLVLVTMGHVGAISGFGADAVQTLLDGVLAPLRNTHKFDVVVRLPLVMGLCHAVTVLTRRTGTHAVPVPTSVGVGVLACAALFGSTVPAWTGAIAPRDSFTEIPQYWRTAATWLGEEANGRTLLTPATPFGDHVWGKTGDEPLQPLASSPWAVRNLVPLAPGGNIEMLDAVSNQLATGRGSAGFAAYLRRAGVGTIVVRHDIDRAQDVVPPELVRATLESTPGMTKAAEFGPEIGGGPTITGEDGREVFVDQGWQARRPALEVYTLDTPVASRSRQALDRTPVLVGDADSLLALDELGPTTGRSTVMAKDADRRRPYGGTILTDGHRRREVAFGQVNHQRSGSLTTSEPFRSDRRVHRYDDAALRDWTTVPELRGAEGISASSSRSDVGALPFLDMAAQPWAGFDGDPATAWRPDLKEAGTRSWLRLDLGRERDLGTVTITLDIPPDESRQLRVTTGAGVRTVRVQGDSPARVEVGRVDRLTVSGISTLEQGLAIRDIVASSVPLSRPLVLPELPASWATPGQILLQAGAGYADGCIVLSGFQRCSDVHAAQGDSGRVLDREVRLPRAGEYEVGLRVAPRGGDALTAVVQRDQLVTASASSQLSDAAAAGAVAAFDDDRFTGWVAGADDDDPTLSLRWVGERRIDSLRLRTDRVLAASRPTAVRLDFGDGTSTSADVQDGRVEFPAVTTDGVDVHVVESRPRLSVDFDGAVRKLPVGVSEMSAPGIDSPTLSVEPLNLLCGSGPEIRVDGERRRTAVIASARELASGVHVDARICGGDVTELRRGTTRVTVADTDAFRPVDLLLSAPDADPAPTDATTAVEATRHNANSGWVARADGEPADPVVLDGWKQGWMVPTGAGRVAESFPAGIAHRWALGLGASALVALVVVALLPGSPRRRALARSPDRPTPHPALLPTAGVVAGAVLAGPLGALLATAGFATAVVLRGRIEPALAAAAVVTAAGVFAVVRPWAGFESWAGTMAAPQLLVTFALGVLVVDGPFRPTFLSRKQGRSTTR